VQQPSKLSASITAPASFPTARTASSKRRRRGFIDIVQRPPPSADSKTASFRFQCCPGPIGFELRLSAAAGLHPLARPAKRPNGNRTWRQGHETPQATHGPMWFFSPTDRFHAAGSAQPIPPCPEPIAAAAKPESDRGRGQPEEWTRPQQRPSVRSFHTRRRWRCWLYPSNPEKRQFVLHVGFARRLSPLPSHSQPQRASRSARGNFLAGRCAPLSRRPPVVQNRSFQLIGTPSQQVQTPGLRGPRSPRGTGFGPAARSAVTRAIDTVPSRGVRQSRQE